jgi:hypothetical protein
MTAPTLAIVIAATDSADAVVRCVASLGGNRNFPVIVAYDPSRVDGSRLPRDIVAVSGESEANAHRLRRLGLNAARETVVAFTEDSCILSVTWPDAWLAAFADPSLIAATGPVECLRGGSAWDEAVFLCEYAPFLASDAQASRLAGNNFAIRASAIPRGSADIHESEIAGIPGDAAFLPAAAVIHARRFTPQAAIRDRLRFGFQYGRLRAGRSPMRPVYVALGPAILGSQLVRLGWTLARKRRGGSALIAAGLLTLLLLTAWSVGEWLGWLAGESPRRARTPDETAARTPAPQPARSRSARLGCKAAQASA